MFKNLFSGHRGRNLKEYLTGYAMIAPAVTLIFTFGIFPVFFALYVSLHKWRIKKGDLLGLANYEKAVSNLTYIILFALGIAAFIGVYFIIRRIIQTASENEENPWLFLIPVFFCAAAAFTFLRWVITLLPELLAIADKIIGQEKTRLLFQNFLKDAFTAERVLSAWRTLLIIIFLALLFGILSALLKPGPRYLNYQTNFGLSWFAGGSGIVLLSYTYQSVAKQYQLAFDNGTDPGIWPQVITISSGVILLGIAWKVWSTASHQNRNRSFWVHLFAALVLMVGGWLLISELPVLLAAGDDDVWVGLKTTVFYSLGTIPFQLAFSIFLAVLLFQRIRGSELFRMLFFLPYVTPAVASAAVFKQLFSTRPQAPINQALITMGIEPLKWLNEPSGVFDLIGEKIGFSLPAWASGPSLALVVIMVFSIWTFVGYNTVIYLAGLGNIPTELHEAAGIDGAGRWQVFRHITLPLLSPTTYFLTLIAVIGTFKAFNHIWVMRQDLALGTTDTFSVMIFLEFFEKLQYGYATALAFVLFAVILSLTFINNRIQGSRVFYG